MTVAGTGYTGEDGVECAVPVAGAAELWDAAPRRRRRARGARRSRHAAARGRVAAARPRARPGHHTAAGRPGLGRVVGQGRLPRPRRARRREGARASPGDSAGLRVEGRVRRAPSSRSSSAARSAGVVTSGNFSPMLEHGIALGFVPPDGRDRRLRRDRRARRPVAGRGREDAVRVALTRRQVVPRASRSAWYSPIDFIWALIVAVTNVSPSPMTQSYDAWTGWSCPWKCGMTYCAKSS